MGCCFSKKTNTTAPLTPATDDHKPPHTTNDVKKELFVIKHRLSHDTDRHSDQGSDKNPLSLRTPSFTNEDVDSVLVQCHTLSRNSSNGTQNPSYRRRRSRSNSDCNTIADVDINALDSHPQQQEVRVSRCSSKERRISISPSRRSNSKERRISISPSRRSQSPFSCKNNLNPPPNRPAKMVSVPPTDKSNNVGVQQPAVKRIHVKRNVSPARIRVFSDDTSQDQESNSSRDTAYRRKSLVEIDNNAGRSARPRDTKRTRRLSRDLDMNPVPVFEPSPSPSASLSGSPPSYASLLLEDIQNFHKKNTVSVATTQPAFALPECVSKACLIMEAVADMNSNTSSLCSDERWRNTTMKESSGMT